MVRFNTLSEKIEIDIAFDEIIERVCLRRRTMAETSWSFAYKDRLTRCSEWAIGLGLVLFTLFFSLLPNNIKSRIGVQLRACFFVGAALILLSVTYGIAIFLSRQISRKGEAEYSMLLEMRELLDSLDPSAIINAKIGNQETIELQSALEKQLEPEKAQVKALCDSMVRKRWWVLGQLATFIVGVAMISFPAMVYSYRVLFK